MDISALPPALHAFLFECIEDYEQLELLVLLQRETGRWWNCAESARQLGIPESLTASALQELVRHRLAEMRGDLQREFRYAAATPELEYKTRLLVRHYNDHRLEIVKQMSANAIERLRTAALRTFADAFVIRRASDRQDDTPDEKPPPPDRRKDDDR